MLARDLGQWLEEAIDGANDVLAAKYGYRPGVKADFLTAEFRKALKDRVAEEFEELGIKPDTVIYSPERAHLDPEFGKSLAEASSAQVGDRGLRRTAVRKKR